jgi:hypothetical protein
VPPQPDSTGLSGGKQKFIYEYFPRLNPLLFSASKLSHVSPVEVLPLITKHIKLNRKSVIEGSIRRKSGDNVSIRKLISQRRSSLPINDANDNKIDLLSASECIKSIYLTLLAQYSRYLSAKSGVKKGKFKSTSQIIGKYANANTSVLYDDNFSKTSFESKHDNERPILRGDVILKIKDEELGEVEISLPSTPSEVLSDEEKMMSTIFENRVFLNTNHSIHTAINVLKHMTRVKEMPDEIVFRLIADACASDYFPYRALDLMLAMEKADILIDSKIAGKISQAFSVSSIDEIANMSSADIMYVSNWKSIKQNLIDSDINTESIDSNIPLIKPEKSYFEDVNIHEWIDFDSYYPETEMRYPKWRRRKIIRGEVETFCLNQWSDELITRLYPGLHIDLNNPFGTFCSNTRCGRGLTLPEIEKGWDTNPNNYKVKCIYCTNEFVPKFTVLCENMKDIMDEDDFDRILWCEFLSPWALNKEIKKLLIEDGIKSFLSPHFRLVHRTIFWNLIIYFRKFGLPYAFLLSSNQGGSS